MLLSWKDKKIYLCNLIKAVSDYFGGDDETWLRQYAKNTVETNKEDIGKAICCFELIARGLEIKPYQSPKNDVKMDICNKCKYRNMFCQCI